MEAIFYEDSWDAEFAGLIEPDSCIQTEINSGQLENKDTHVYHEPTDQVPQSAIKREYSSDGDISKSHSEPNTEPKHNCYLCKKIKKEPEENVQQFDNVTGGELGYLITPIKSEFIRDDSNPTPFDKELFEHISLHGPQTKPDTPEYAQEEFRKTVARTSFEQKFSETCSDRSTDNTNDSELFRKFSTRYRLGPIFQDNDSYDENRILVKRRLEPEPMKDDYVPSQKIRKISQEYESDPEVLRKGQNQIDQGENTLGHDQYREKVSLDQRSGDDPKTPNEYVNYSSRDWDELIEQWKLKLHEYDSKDSSSEVPVRPMSHPVLLGVSDINLPSSPPAPNETGQLRRAERDPVQIWLPRKRVRSPSSPWPVAAEPAGMISPPSSPSYEILSSSDRWTMDSLISAIRAKPQDQQWSLELRDALSALRPSNNPTGRCRRRLKASDGTVIRVCLPKKRVRSPSPHWSVVDQPAEIIPSPYSSETEIPSVKSPFLIPSPSSPRNEIPSVGFPFPAWPVAALPAGIISSPFSPRIEILSVRFPFLIPSPTNEIPLVEFPFPAWPMAAQPAGIVPSPFSPRTDIPSVKFPFLIPSLSSPRNEIPSVGFPFPAWPVAAQPARIIPSPYSSRTDIPSVRFPFLIPSPTNEISSVRSPSQPSSPKNEITSDRSPFLPPSLSSPKNEIMSVRSPFILPSPSSSKNEIVTVRSPSQPSSPKNESSSVRSPFPIPPPSSPKNDISSSSDRWTTDSLICAVRASPSFEQWSPELRDALSALRPPNNPTGRCRRRLIASDGTKLRVWLPKKKVRSPSPPWPVAAHPAGIIPSSSSPTNEIPSVRSPSLLPSPSASKNENLSVRSLSSTCPMAVQPAGIIPSPSVRLDSLIPSPSSPKNEITSVRSPSLILSPSSPKNEYPSVRSPFLLPSPSSPKNEILTVRSPSQPSSPKNEITSVGSPLILPSPSSPKNEILTVRSPSQPSSLKNELASVRSPPLIPPPSSPKNETPSSSDHWTTDSLICAVRANPSFEQWSPELRDALSALRPPNNPTGRCRRRLIASDGTKLRVWLPKKRDRSPSPSSPKNEILTVRSPSPTWHVAAQSGGIIPSLPPPRNEIPSVIAPSLILPPSSPKNEIPSPSDRWTRDSLVCAVRANPSFEQWSPELREALSALRPPNNPTGRCRLRLMASDGSRVRVWLPKKRVRSPSPPWPVAAQPAGIIPSSSSPTNEIPSVISPSLIPPPSSPRNEIQFVRSISLLTSPSSPKNEITSLRYPSLFPSPKNEILTVKSPSQPSSLKNEITSVGSPSLIPSPSSPKNEILTVRSPSPTWHVAAQSGGIIPSLPPPRNEIPSVIAPSLILPPSSPKNEIPSPSDRWTRDSLVCAVRANPSFEQWSPELREALSALRPPNNPTGRCRLRLMASDGSRVRVWLPKKRVRSPSPPWPVAAQPAGIIPSSSSPTNEIPSVISPSLIPPPSSPRNEIQFVRSISLLTSPSSPKNEITSLRYPSLFPSPKNEILTVKSPSQPSSLKNEITSVGSPSLIPSPSSPKNEILTVRSPSPTWHVAAQSGGIIPSLPPPRNEIPSVIAPSLILPPSSPKNEIPSSSDRWTRDSLVCAVRANPSFEQWSPELREALSALRPPNNPTGRCRLRLMASDGSRVRVWLPKKRVRSPSPPWPVAAQPAGIIPSSSSPTNEIPSVISPSLIPPPSSPRNEIQFVRSISLLTSPSSPKNEITSLRSPSLFPSPKNEILTVKSPSQPSSLKNEITSVGSPSLIPSPSSPKNEILTVRSPSPTWHVAAQSGGIIPSLPPPTNEIPSVITPSLILPPSSPKNEIPSSSDRWTRDSLVCAVRANPSFEQWSPELREALSALRPPNNPTGRCRLRLMASDGSRVRVWLPKKRVRSLSPTWPMVAQPVEIISSSPSSRDEIASVRYPSLLPSPSSPRNDIPSVRSPSLLSSPSSPRNEILSVGSSSPPWPVAAQPVEITPSSSSSRNRSRLLDSIP